MMNQQEIQITVQATALILIALPTIWLIIRGINAVLSESAWDTGKKTGKYAGLLK